MSERYPIKLEKPVKTMGGEIVHAKASRGAEGWELWGQIPGGGEKHLDTRYYREGSEMPPEWHKKVATRYFGDTCYDYYEKGREIYQSKDGGKLIWFCSAAVVEMMLGNDLDL